MDPLDTYIAEWAPRVDAALDAVLPGEDVRPETVHRAMRYTVFAGGKRIRPVLCLLSARAAGADEEAAMPAACAVEMIHAFSLIHDDLPCMDDDDLRRGKPTNHVVYGEGMAVLAGDALLTHAFGVLARLPDEVVPGAVRDLAEAVGTAGLMGGQVEDLEAEGKEPDLAVVERIHTQKTGALIRACTRLGVLAARGDERTYDLLSAYGARIGFAFQIVDDVLDETGGDGKLGKTAGKDLKDRKMTYPAAAGLDAAVAKARELAGEARDLVEGLECGDLLAALADRVVKRTH